MSTYRIARAMLCDQRIVLAAVHETLSTAMEGADIPSSVRVEFVSVVHDLGNNIIYLDKVLKVLNAEIKKETK